jgi:hypothetical protein
MGPASLAMYTGADTSRLRNGCRDARPWFPRARPCKSIPVSKFEFVINLWTATAIGLTFRLAASPAQIPAFADQNPKRDATRD